VAAGLDALPDAEDEVAVVLLDQRGVGRVETDDDRRPSGAGPWRATAAISACASSAAAAKIPVLMNAYAAFESVVS
jgi:hypothetical protein